MTTIIKDVLNDQRSLVSTVLLVHSRRPSEGDQRSSVSTVLLVHSQRPSLGRHVGWTTTGHDRHDLRCSELPARFSPYSAFG